jgi:hypothetical protein
MVNALAMLVSVALLSALSAEIMVAAVIIVLVWKPAALSAKEKHVVDARQAAALREPVSVMER